MGKDESGDRAATCQYQGETTIHGEIIHVARGSIRVKTLDDQIVSCSIDDATFKKVLAKVGTGIHALVELRGRAEWHPKTFRIESFSIDDLTGYAPTPMVEAFEELAKVRSLKIYVSSRPHSCYNLRTLRVSRNACRRRVEAVGTLLSKLDCKLDFTSGG